VEVSDDDDDLLPSVPVVGPPQVQVHHFPAGATGVGEHLLTASGYQRRERAMPVEGEVDREGTGGTGSLDFDLSRVREESVSSEDEESPAVGEGQGAPQRESSDPEREDEFLTPSSEDNTPLGSPEGSPTRREGSV
jgi:hypothetical protein